MGILRDFIIKSEIELLKELPYDDMIFSSINFVIIDKKGYLKTGSHTFDVLLNAPEMMISEIKGFYPDCTFVCFLTKEFDISYVQNFLIENKIKFEKEFDNKGNWKLFI